MAEASRRADARNSELPGLMSGRSVMTQAINTAALLATLAAVVIVMRIAG